MVDAGSPAEGQGGVSSEQEPGDLQVAQSTTAGSHGDAIGTVNEATGDVFIVHKDGTSEQVAAGTPVYADDIVATGTDGAVEVVFNDGTTFSLGNNGQMRLDSLIYDPAGTNNGLDATIVKGSFVFITGNVGSAQGEGVSIDTPAGTIGIRGTSGGVVQDAQTGTWIFTLFRDPDGKLSHFTVTNPAGQQLLDQEFETTEVAGFRTAPAQTIVLSPAQASILFADALHMLQQQFPQLQRSELDINPAAGEEDQIAVDPGQLPPSPESLSAMFGMNALGLALLDLLGDDTQSGVGSSGGGAPPTIDGGPPTFEPTTGSSPIILGSDDAVVTEDTAPNPATGNVLDNDSDVQGAVLGVSAVNGNAANVGEPTSGVYGTLQLNADGTYVYTLDNEKLAVQALGEGQTANDVFTYTVTDGLGHAATATLTIVVSGINDQPEAAVDANTAPEDAGPVSGNVLANDSDVDSGDVLAVSAVAGSADNVGTPLEGTYGTLQLNANGTYSYVLDNGKEAVQALGEGQQAQDTFSYTISDGHGGTSTATLTITVTGTNDAPVAEADTAAATEDGAPVSGNVLSNDGDVDTGDQLKVGTVNGSADNVGEPIAGTYGTLQLNEDGTYSYALNNDSPAVQALAAGQTAPDQFSYTVSDGHGGTSTATLTITVTGTDDGPVAVDDVNAVTEDAPPDAVSGNVLDNDSDVDTGDVLTVSAVAASAANVGAPIEGTYGTLQLNADGSYSYTLDSGRDAVQALAEGQTATDAFSYTISDGHGGTSTATLTITVTGTNDAPVAVADATTVAEDTEPNPVSGSVLANDTDVDATDQLTVTAVAGSADNVGESIGGAYGTLQLNEDGSYSYTLDNGKGAVQALAAGQTATDEFSYAISDGHGGTATATLTITVTGTDDAPVLQADVNAVTEDTAPNPVSGNVLDNDSDVDTGDVLTVSAVGGSADNVGESVGGTYGTLQLNEDGSYSYTLDNGREAVQALGAGQTATDVFSYTVSDGHGGSATATLTITVTGTNDGPVAVNDSYTVAEDNALTVAPAAGVLANDGDVDNDGLTATLLSGPQHGDLVFKSDGSFTYTPDENFNGADSFTYKASDGTVSSDPVTVTLTVQPVNDAPVSVGESYSTDEDKALVVTGPGVLTNDSDIDSATLTAVLQSGPAHGSLELNPDGSFTYTPDADFNGTDSFTYKASDGALSSDPVTVTLTVNPVNDAPVGKGDSYSTNEDTALTVAGPGVLGNDSDIDSATLTAVLQTGPAHGSLELNADGSFTYTPDANFNGTDSFTYKAGDGALSSDPVTVTLTVNPVNDAPVAAGDAYGTDEDKALIVAGPGVLANDSDIDSATLTAVLQTGPAHGSLALNPDGSFTYTPDVDFNGTDSFTYKASDGTLSSAPVTVSLTINPVNDAPVGKGDSYSTNEDTALTVTGPGVLGNDTDVDSATLTALLQTGPAHGSLTLNADGSFTYTPNANFNGTDSFTYKASDGSLSSAPVTVNLTVNPVNDAPVAKADSYSTNEDTALTVTGPGVLGNDSDIDSATLTAVLQTGPAHGSLELNADGSFTYTPDANFNGTDSFTYKASDGALSSDPVTVNLTINPVNDAPVAKADSYSTNEDTVLTVSGPGVLGNDSDIDSATLTAVLQTGPAHGSLTLNPDGSFTYTPNADFNGTDSFTYKAGDGALSSDPVTVNLTINPVNDPPVGKGDSYSTNEDTALTVAAPGVLANDTDIDSAALTAILVTGPAHGTLTLNANGSFTYTPAADYNGADSFTYKASDGTAFSAPVTVSLTVNPVNDAPVAKDDTATTAEDTALLLTAASLLGNDSDVDHDPLTITAVGEALHGTVALNADGAVVYTPDENYNGLDSFTYTVSDGHGGFDNATVTLTVTPVNDPPVAGDDNFSVDQGQALTIDAASILANDTDVEHDPLSISAVGAAQHGTVALNADGSVTYTPNAGYDGADSFAYTVSDGHGGTDSGLISIDVKDSAPVALRDDVETADRTSQTINLVIILDLSGSMANSPGVAGFSTRLELARAAIAALFAAHDSVADLNIQIVGFSTTATASGWLGSVEDANAYLATLATGGNTSYTAAIDQAMASYAGAPDADKTEVYFLSDGEPTAGQGLTADKTAQWEAFLTNNNVDQAFAVGIGTGISPTDPDLAAVAFPSNPIVVTNESQLIDTLVGTVANPVSGNVLENDTFGPDGKGNHGGGVLSITVNGVTYSYDGTTISSSGTPPHAPQIDGATIVVITSLGGTLEFHFDTGDYTYTPPDVSGPTSEEFGYAIVDGDGSTDSSVLHIDITDSGIVETNPHTVIGTDKGESLVGADGTVADIMSGGAGNDSISGGAGDDHIQGGAGSDTLSGGDGNDILIGGDGSDKLAGGAGDDRIVVGAGDSADGGDGHDVLLLTSNTEFTVVHGGGEAPVDLASDPGDVLSFNGTLNLTAIANNKIDGIETVSMSDSTAGAGADTLTINAQDVIDLGTGHVDPAGSFGDFGELKDAQAIRVDGDGNDTLNLTGGGWQQVTSGPAGLPAGYTLYVHDDTAPGAAADAYVLVQTAVKVTTG